MRQLLMSVAFCMVCLGVKSDTAEETSSPRKTRVPEPDRAVTGHQETRNDPWMPGSTETPRGGTEHCGTWERGPYKSIQINVDAQGCNIVGDAANEPSMAIDPIDPNKIVIGWRQFDSVESDFRQAGWAYSHDGGESWTFPGVLEQGVFRSDPVLDADADGNIYFYSLTDDLTCDLFKSTDGGLSWIDPVSAFGGDKPWMAVDRTDGIGRGNIYAVWGGFTRSTDGGLTFEEPLFVGGEFPSATVGPDGTLYVAGRAQFQGTAPLVSSVDAQDPAATPSFATSVARLNGGTPNALLGGPNPGGLLGQIWVATDHSGGSTHDNVYLLGSVEPANFQNVIFYPMDVSFVRGTDGDFTFSYPIRVNDDPIDNLAWQWFAMMSVAPNGRIDAAWNDTRNDDQGTLATHSELFYAYSTDGGDRWSPNIPVSPSFNHSVGYPGGNRKLGDYYDIISDNGAANVAYAATFNGEQDVYYLRIAVDCNANDIHDGTDILSGTSEDLNANAVPDECENRITLYVDKNATGANDGSSWSDAYIHLQDALDEVELPHIAFGEVWVAAETYTPDRGAEQTAGDRNATFQLVSGVTIYGGFSGEETNLDDRAPWRNVTILSGDLNGDDQVRSDTNCCEDRSKPGCESASCESAVCARDSFCCDDAWGPICVDLAEEFCGFCCESRCHRNDNSIHVVTGSGTDALAQLDGFVVTGGMGDGGGMFIQYGSPIVRNCIFDDNVGTQGGAFFVEDGSPTVIDSIFSHNEANAGSGAGGAVYLRLRGSGVSHRATFLNCLFYKNHALNSGGGLTKPPGPGGGGHTVELGNCTFAFNSTDGNVGGVVGVGVITNSILWGNSDVGGTDETAQLNVPGGINHSCVQGWTGKLGGVGNFSDDPLFVGGPLGSYYLSRGATGQPVDSPCVDAGSDTAVNLALDNTTTRTDECPDTGTADIGYHFPIRMPEHAGDFDRSGLVDLLDAAAFQNCFTGPAPASVDPCCRILDAEPDGDIDHDDYLAFYLSFTDQAGVIAKVLSE